MRTLKTRTLANMISMALIAREWKIPKGQTPNKYKNPHQGKRECARRVRQMSRIPLESKPRRMWECTWLVSENITATVFDSKRRYIAKVAKFNFVEAVLLP